jgi:hypothetical protein
MVILTTERYFDARNVGDEDWKDRIVVQPVCAEHAPEQAHEARSSMSDDEFVIVNLPDPRTCIHGRVECLRCGHWSLGGGAPKTLVSRAWEENQCGHFDPLLGPCVCGDPANHKPGGKYHKEVAS